MEPVCDKTIKEVVLWDLVKKRSVVVGGLSIPPGRGLGSCMANGFGKLVGAVSSNLNRALDFMEGGRPRYARGFEVVYKDGGKAFKVLRGERGPRMKGKQRVYDDVQWAGNLESLVQTGEYST